MLLAAKNMQGEPIPGRHWLEIDLQDIHTVEKIVIDWERAFSDQWTVIVSYFVDIVSTM